MEPTTQAALVLGLLALLAVLLVGRSAGRRRARRAAAGAEVAPEPRVAELPEAETEPEPEPQPEAEAQPEPEPEADAQPEVEAQLEPEPEPELAAQPESPAEAEPAPQAEVPARRRGLFRRRRRNDEVVPTTVVAAPVAVADDVETQDQAELRALREQLRALEQVVQQQAADHPTAALARVEETAAEQSAAYLRQVSLVVRGLAAHTGEDENPRRTLARVAAAVERLGVPNEMARPILPVTNELPTRSQPDGSETPSHLLEVTGVGDGDHPVLPAPSPVADVFDRIDSAPAADPQEHTQRSVHETAVTSVATVAPVAPAVSYSDLAAVARYDEAVAPVQVTEPPPVHEPEVEVGIPTFEAPTVLPVPAPAAPQPTGRRRGRLRPSR